VIATGRYSEPFLPKFPGQNKFNGPIVCPSVIKSSDQVENKRIVVIGGCKCATDMAVFAGRFARSCYLVFRSAHWMIPRTIMAGHVPGSFFCTRVSTIPFIPFPDAPRTTLFRFLHRKFPKFAIKMSDNMGADMMAIHGPDLFNDKIFIPRYSFRNEDRL